MSSLSDAEKGLHDQSKTLTRPKFLCALTVASVTSIVASMGQNGISIMLPTMARDLQAHDTISWAGTSVLVANTAFTPLYGRLSDIFGRKPMFLMANALLALGDLLCGLSTTSSILYISRGIGGIGGCGVLSLGTIIISDIVTLEERGKYQSIISAMVGIGNAAGLFVGAVFASKSSWRGFFLMLAGFGLLNSIIVYFWLPSTPPTAGFKENILKIDWLGIVTVTAAVIFLLLPIAGGGHYFAWESPMVITMLVLGTLCLFSFIFVEWKVAALPMMPLSMFRNPAVVIILAQTALLSFVCQSYLFYMPLYLQNVQRHSTVISALMFSPSLAIQCIVGIGTGYWMLRYKRYGLVIKLGLTVIMLASGLMLVYNRYTPAGVVVLPLIVFGTGYGLTSQPALVALQAHATNSHRAAIISSRNFFRCIGGAVGLAVSAAVLQARLTAALPTEYSYLSESSYDLPERAQGYPSEVFDAYMSSSYAVLILQAPLVGLCFLSAFFIVDKGLTAVDESPNQQVDDGNDDKLNFSHSPLGGETDDSQVVVGKPAADKA